MAVKLSHKKLTAVVTYSTDVVKGKHASVSAVNPLDGDVLEEKKDIDNDGNVTLTFPEGYHGECKISVHGSAHDSGTDEGTIEL